VETRHKNENSLIAAWVIVGERLLGRKNRSTSTHPAPEASKFVNTCNVPATRTRKQRKSRRTPPVTQKRFIPPERLWRRTAGSRPTSDTRPTPW
jgi:hypothetical protein